MADLEKEALEYSEEACKEKHISDFELQLKVYHAYKAGWIASEPETGSWHLIFLGMMLGMILLLFILVVIKSLFDISIYS